MSIQVLSKPSETDSYCSSDEGLAIERSSRGLLAYDVKSPVYPPDSDEADENKKKTSKNEQPDVSANRDNKELTKKKKRKIFKKCKKEDQKKGKKVLKKRSKRKSEEA